MANLAPTQVEQLQRIGAHLRTVRQEQGLSLDILANQIFIRPALLQALETGREEQLPEAVFIQGFIRRYAEALGLDGKAIAQEFVVSPPPMVPSPDLSAPAESSAPATPVAAAKPTPVPAPTPVSAPAPVPVIKSAPEPAPTSVVQPAPTPAAEPPKAPVAPRPASTPQTAPLANPFPLADSMAEEQRGGGFPLWLILVGAVLLIGGGLGLWLGRGSNPQTATPPAEAPAPAETPVPEEPVAAEPEPEPEPEPVALEAPIVVAVRLSEPSWLSVVADGRTVYEGTSDSGYEETWTAQTSLVFITGNAGGVSLSFNGEDPVVLGDSGAVRTLRLTPDSEAAELASP